MYSHLLILLFASVSVLSAPTPNPQTSLPVTHETRGVLYDISDVNQRHLWAKDVLKRASIYYPTWKPLHLISYGQRNDLPGMFTIRGLRLTKCMRFAMEHFIQGPPETAAIPEQDPPADFAESFPRLTHQEQTEIVRKMLRTGMTEQQADLLESLSHIRSVTATERLQSFDDPGFQRWERGFMTRFMQSTMTALQVYTYTEYDAERDPNNVWVYFTPADMAVWTTLPFDMKATLGAIFVVYRDCRKLNEAMESALTGRPDPVGEPPLQKGQDDVVGYSEVD